MRLDSETVREQALPYLFKLTPLYFLAQKNLHFQDQMLFKDLLSVKEGRKATKLS